MANNGVAVYLHAILYTFYKTATGSPTKWENIKMELGAGGGNGN